MKDLLVVAAPDGIEVDRIAAPKPLQAAQAKLARLQRRAARRRGPYDPDTKSRQESSNRWQRAHARVSKTHARVANLRRHALHEATTTLARQHSVIVVENLSIDGMTRRGGKRKRGLNRSLADASLARVRTMLGYKSCWYGATLVTADRWFDSTQLCSGCGAKTKLPLHERIYCCGTCDLGAIDRDLNAAINLARLGEPNHLGGASRTGTGSSPAANPTVGEGRGADRKTRPTTVRKAGGVETSTPHDHAMIDQTGTADPQGTAA